ncbi:hypothetical protein FXO38_14505 [Capsicum annuum]|nr:hypothetical protein FXO38_14505 [Capsicum annuum]
MEFENSLVESEKDFVDLKMSFVDFETYFVDLGVDFMDLGADFVDLKMGFGDSGMNFMDLETDFVGLRMDFMDALGRRFGVRWPTLVEAGLDYYGEIIVVVAIDMVVVDCLLYVVGGEKINGNGTGWVPFKPVIVMHGEPSVTWKSSEVKNLIIQENLQYAIIGKFSYGKPDVNELRKVIPKQYVIKGECLIGVLDTRHILIRLNQLEDYIQMLSTSSYYIMAKDMSWRIRTLKWDPWIESEIEKIIGVACISFPDLPLIFFEKEAIFSIASAVGKPLMVDMATKNYTGPSCAHVKVEVDLVAKLPHRVKINEEDEVSGEIKSKWIKI